MLSETIHTWTPSVWSFIDNANDEDSDTTVDANSLLNATEVAALQLQDLFGQDLFDFDTSDSPYYDEFTFVPEQTQNELEPINETLKRRRSSTSSLSSYVSSFISRDDLGSFSSSISSYIEEEEDDEDVFPPMERRVLEEIILEKISYQLDPEKLPGILTIISTSNVEDDAEEVEIDLARLDLDQLMRILVYIDGCLHEKPVHTKKKKSRPSVVTVEQGHVVKGELHSSSSSVSHQGPMSSVMESDSDSSLLKRKKRTKKRNKQKNNKNHKKEKTMSNKKPALHKRRLLEEMTHPANNETEEEETEGGDGIVIFGDEQMDFAVTQNQTIVHQQQQQQQSIMIQSKPVVSVPNDSSEDDELIDIMV